MFLRWFWADRFAIDESWLRPEKWEGCEDGECDDDDCEYSERESIMCVMERCIGAYDLYGIDCHFRTAYCPCAMVIDCP